MIKQRVGRPGQGRRGGFRTLIAYQAGERALFLYGFAKNERDNIGDDDLRRLKRFAREALSWTANQVASLVVNGEWREVQNA